MVKPKLVAQPAIVRGFFLRPSFELWLQTILILSDQQSDDKQPIKLTHTIVNINKATCCPNLSYLYKYLCIHGKCITCSMVNIDLRNIKTN